MEHKLYKTQNGSFFILRDDKRIYFGPAAAAAYAEGCKKFSFFTITVDRNGKKIKEPFTILIPALEAVDTITVIE